MKPISYKGFADIYGFCVTFAGRIFDESVAMKKEFQLCYVSSSFGLRELNDRFISLMFKFRDESSSTSLNELFDH